MEIREYKVGDRLKNVHWKLSARSEELMVRQFSYFAEKSAAVILDMSAPAQEGCKGMNDMISLALGVVRFALAHQCCIYLAWYNPRDRVIEREWIEEEAQLYEALYNVYQADLYEEREMISAMYERLYPEERVRIGINRRLEVWYNEEVKLRYWREDMEDGASGQERKTE